MSLRIPKETTNLKIVEHYICTVPGCGELIPRNNGEDNKRYFRRALRHSKIPIDRPLPKGLVFKNETEFFKDYFLIVRMGELISGIDSLEEEYTHTYKQSVIDFEIKDRKLKIKSPYRVLSSKRIKELLKNGTFRLLNETEFKEFQSIYEENRHVYEGVHHLTMERTNFELEKLLANPNS